jgi:NAD(P)-dependent dehydrogenase (short-subunit alcohol dehydrogenase family)
MTAPTVFDLRRKRVFVTGHAGMVGAAIVRRLEREGCDIIFAARRDLDLRQSEQVERFMMQARPDAVFAAAGKVGGIAANTAPPPILSQTIWRWRSIQFVPRIAPASGNWSISDRPASTLDWRRSR